MAADRSTDSVQSDARFRAMIEALPDPVGLHTAVRDAAGRIVDFRVDYLNAPAARWARIPAEAAVGRPLSQVFPDFKQKGVFDAYRRVVETGHPVSEETVSYSGSVEEQYIAAAHDYRAVKFGDGVLAVWHETTRRKREELEHYDAAVRLRESEERHRLLFQEAADPILLVNREDGRIVDFNANAVREFGYAPEELRGQSVLLLDGGFWKQLQSQAGGAAGGVVLCDTRLRLKDGQSRDYHVHSRLLKVSARDVVQMICRDITERKRREAEVESMSLSDELTGLHNRRGFVLQALQARRHARATAGEMALFYIDVDNLKEINDAHGHIAGDRALVTLANGLRACIGDGDVLGRLGGDEFAVLMPHADGRHESFAARLRACLEAEARETAQPLVSVSMGRSVCPAAHAPHVQEFLAEGDRLMYEEKRRKRAAAGREGASRAFGPSSV